MPIDPRFPGLRCRDTRNRGQYDGEDVGGNVDQNHAPAGPEEPVLFSVRDEDVDPFKKNGCFEENHE